MRPDPLPQIQSTESPVAVARDVRLRAMFDRDYDFVWRSLRRLGIPQLTVDDAAQEVFLVAARRLDDIEVGRERSFLFATALRKASDVRRALARRSEVIDEVEHIADDAPGPDELADRQRARVVLDRVLAGMDLELRAVFVLFELEEMTMIDIAATLELAPGTVASRLRRARDSFRLAARRERVS